MSKQKHLTPPQYKALLKHLDDQPISPWMVALRLMLRTGCRSIELLRINREHLDKTNSFICIPAAKGSSDRNIPLSKSMLSDVALILDDYSSFDQALGSSKESTKLRELRRRFKLEVFRALGSGFGHVSPHSARSSFAVNIYLNGGKDILLVQELLGHKAIGSTMYYVKMSRALERKKGLIKTIG